MSDAPTNVTLRDLGRMARSGAKFSCLTCYDATTARWLERAGVEVLLVGDTAAEMVLGFPSTVHAPLDFMVAPAVRIRVAEERGLRALPRDRRTDRAVDLGGARAGADHALRGLECRGHDRSCALDRGDLVGRAQRDRAVALFAHGHDGGTLGDGLAHSRTLLRRLPLASPPWPRKPS